VVALHEGGQSVKKNLRPIQRIHMQLCMIFSAQIVWIHHNRRNMEVVPFRTDTLAISKRDSIGNHNGANVAASQNLQRGISR
jgi:ABC-type histidine transport system ATPase subunit